MDITNDNEAWQTAWKRLSDIVAECTALWQEHERLKARSDEIVARLGALQDECAAIAQLLQQKP